MPGDSFTFRNINSLTQWGIKVIAYDVFSAGKRNRSRTIPFRHGEYDYGEKFYDTRTVKLDCVTEDRVLTKAEMREVIYWLSKRSQLILWDEPDKFYVGELMQSVDVNVFPKRTKQQFTLPMVCEPFAYGPQNIIEFSQGINKVEYNGTASTPTHIIIRNPNPFPVTKIRITGIQHQ